MKAAKVDDTSNEFPSLTLEMLRADKKRRGIQAPRARSGVGEKNGRECQGFYPSKPATPSISPSASAVDLGGSSNASEVVVAEVNATRDIPMEDAPATVGRLDESMLVAGAPCVFGPGETRSQRGARDFQDHAGEADAGVRGAIHPHDAVH